MLRLRFFRILLPALLILLGGLLVWSLKPRGSVHSLPAGAGTHDAPRVGGLTFIEFQGSSRSIAGDADLFQPGEDGRLHLEGIRDLEIEREDRGPLNVSAIRGDREGEDGERFWRFEEQVVFGDEEEGLTLRLPRLVVDEEAGEARSAGDIRFDAPNLRGTAASLVYGLRGQPGLLVRPELEDEQGGRLTALEAHLLDGFKDIELVGEVRVSRRGQSIDTDRMRLIRGETDRLQTAEASEGARGSWSMGAGDPAHVEARRLAARFDPSGEVEHLLLTGDAELHRGVESLAASSIEGTRRDDRWDVLAQESVFVRGVFGETRGLLRAERLEAQLDSSLVLQAAEASGRMSFEGTETRAEAERAVFASEPDGGEIRLFGTERRKARLSHGRTRTAGAKIVTDLRGEELVAEGQVEATLLPAAPDARGDREIRLFASEEAIHFVAERLESEQAGSRLAFSGSVRGWQGERNIAAERLVVDQPASTLEARGNVSTRFPRESDVASVSEADYAQIGSDSLDYDDATGRAVYVGEVRLRLAEGWLEAERVEVDLAAGSRNIEQVRAFVKVRLEFHRTSEETAAQPISGQADRVIYDPAESTVRLYGEQEPASVRRIGEGGGTTTGRVLRYRMDLGTLEVDSGGKAPARIRTSGG